MVDWKSNLEYIKLYKDLKLLVPKLQKDQDKPEDPETKKHAVEFMWGLKVLYNKIKENKEINLPHSSLLEQLNQLPNDKTEFEKTVWDKALDVRNNKLCVKSQVGESEPIGDFSSRVLNEIENWALTAMGTFGKK
jgi:hypothetical protein